MFAAKSGLAQGAAEITEKGLEKAREGEFDQAIGLVDRAIRKDPGHYEAWYFRGVTKVNLDEFDEALIDFTESIKLSPMFSEAYLFRGYTRVELTQYDEAMSDYSHAILLDPENAKTYYFRGQLNELLGNTEAACVDFRKALVLEYEPAEEKVKTCNDSVKTKTYPLLRLTKTAENAEYGFTPEHPVKVGQGPDGGPSNNRRYLSLLRDVNGKPVKYKRQGSCCAYESENAFMSLALLDRYEITFTNEKGKEDTATVYISFYDYEEPMILFGFGTIGQK